MKSVQSVKDESLKHIVPEQRDVVARSGELSETSHPLLIARLHQLRKLKSIHNKIDDLNFNAHMIREFNYLCEHNILFFLTATGQFDALRKLLNAKIALAKVFTLKRKIKRKRSRAVAKRHHFPKPTTLLPEMEEQPLIHHDESLLSAQEITKNTPVHYRFFMHSGNDRHVVLIALDKLGQPLQLGK